MVPTKPGVRVGRLRLGVTGSTAGPGIFREGVVGTLIHGGFGATRGSEKEETNKNNDHKKIVIRDKVRTIKGKMKKNVYREAKHKPLETDKNNRNKNYMMGCIVPNWAIKRGVIVDQREKNGVFDKGWAA